jgi:hypothetical protein
VEAARVAKALVVAWEELATARALALANVRAWALLDHTRYSNDSIVYEIAPRPDGALRPREVPPRDRTSNFPPPPRRARALGKLRGSGGKAWAYAPNDVRNPQHPNHNNRTKMKNGAPRASQRGRPPRHIRHLKPAQVTPATPAALVPPTTPKPSATVALVLEVTPATFSQESRVVSKQ